jgi:hypothetical protein
LIVAKEVVGKLNENIVEISERKHLWIAEIFFIIVDRGI